VLHLEVMHVLMNPTGSRFDPNQQRNTIKKKHGVVSKVAPGSNRPIVELGCLRLVGVTVKHVTLPCTARLSQVPTAAKPPPKETKAHSKGSLLKKTKSHLTEQTLAVRRAAGLKKTLGVCKISFVRGVLPQCLCLLNG
jgi:hypothetical protein